MNYLIEKEIKINEKADYKKKYLRLPGIEPGPTPWKGAILPLDYRRIIIKFF